MFHTSIKAIDLAKYVESLVNNYFPDTNGFVEISVKEIMMTLEKIDFLFQNVKKKYYFFQGKSYFDHLNSDHMLIFLYYLLQLLRKK